MACDALAWLRTILGGTSHGRGYGWRIGLIRQFRAVLGGLSRTIVASKSSLASAFWRSVDAGLCRLVDRGHSAGDRDLSELITPLLLMQAALSGD